MTYRSIFDGGIPRTEFEKAGINTQFIYSIWKYATENPNSEWERIPSLTSAAYSLLRSKFKPLTSTLHSAVQSNDNVSTKLLIKLQNGSFVEAVIMRYDTRLGKYCGKPRHGGVRSTLCISSQVGIVHAINKLHSDLPGLNLAVSLHAPVQDVRCQIMPAARAFPLEKLMGALEVYQKNSQQKIFIEYIMLDGVNDDEQHAHQLGKLLEAFQVVVNLISFSPIGTLSQFRTSSEEKVSSFQRILRGTYNIRTTVRKQMGQDISGACGQLVVNLPDKRSIQDPSTTDIEDLCL